MMTIAVFLALACALMCLCLALLLTNRPHLDREGFQEQDAGEVPSSLVETVTMDLLDRDDMQSPRGNASGIRRYNPTTRLERRWQYNDGREGWQVLVCYVDPDDIDFGAKCERLHIEFRPLTETWHMVSRKGASRPHPLRRPSSDALILPGLDRAIRF